MRNGKYLNNGVRAFPIRFVECRVGGLLKAVQPLYTSIHVPKPLHGPIILSSEAVPDVFPSLRGKKAISNIRCSFL